MGAENNILLPFTVPVYQMLVINAQLFTGVFCTLVGEKHSTVFRINSYSHKMFSAVSNSS